MSKPIRSYPEHMRATVIARRLKGQAKGLGYLSAKDAEAKKNEKR